MTRDASANQPITVRVFLDRSILEVYCGGHAPHPEHTFLYTDRHDESRLLAENTGMPRPQLVLPMSIEEFEYMEHRLGWKHEYWDGAAQLSTQETAVVSWQRPVSASGVSRPPHCEGEQLRPVRAEDELSLAELFILTFDDAVEFAGWPADVYRQDARDNIASFFGKPTQRRHHGRSPGRPEASFLFASGEQLLAAVLVRSIRRGPIIEPIMVHPAHQRRGLATTLLSASIHALNACGAARWPGLEYRRCGS